MSSTLLPVLVEDDSTAKREWLLVELQGELRVKESEQPEWKGKRLGRLIDRDTEMPVLIIGSSKLEGKRVKLSKPYAILKRASAGFVSEGVVSEKFVFKTRPKPLTS
jgi:chromosome transmission fidelity protein 8